MYLLTLLGFLIATDDVSEQALALRKLKENWNAVYAEIESVNPDTISVFRPKYAKIWTSDDARCFRLISNREFTPPGRSTPSHIEDCLLISDDFVFIRGLHRYGETGKKISHSARIMSTDSPMFPEFFVESFTGFFGWDKYTGAYWHEVLENPDAAISVKQNAEEMEIRARHRELGDFEFRFEPNKDAWLLRGLKSQNNNVHPVPEKRDVTSYTYEISNIEYRQLGDRNFIESFTERNDTRSKLGESRSFVLQNKMTSLSINHELKDDRIIFPDVEIPDGTRVSVQNDAGIPYEIHRGVLTRVVDSSAIVTADKARFRPPPGASWRYYGILVFIVALAGGIIWYGRRS